MKKLSLLLTAMLAISPVAYASSPAERDIVNKDVSEFVKDKIKSGGYVQDSKGSVVAAQPAEEVKADDKATKNSKKKSKVKGKKSSKSKKKSK